MQSFQDDIYNLKAYETNESTLIRLENTQIQIQSQIQNLENLQKKLEENEDNKAVLSEKINDLSSKRNTLEDEIKTLKIENIYSQHFYKEPILQTFTSPYQQIVLTKR